MFFWNYCLGQKLNARVLLKSGIDESQLLFKLCECFITWKIACVYVCACIYICMYVHIIAYVLQYSLEDQEHQVLIIHISYHF